MSTGRRSSETPSARLVPKPEGLAAEFYAHCATGQLRFQRCKRCHAWRHLPRLLCARCGSSDWAWERSSGRGRIHSWTVTHQAPFPGFAGPLPYAVVVVELEEGVRMVSGLRDVPLERLELDLPVEVVFESVGDQVAVPWFQPRLD